LWDQVTKPYSFLLATTLLKFDNIKPLSSSYGASHDSNPTTKMWERLGSIAICNHHPFEWFKLINICIVMVLGNGSILVDYCLDIFSNDDF
jgi:hypothetical protein